MQFERAIYMVRLIRKEVIYLLEDHNNMAVYILPCLMILESLGAAFFWFKVGNYRKGIYWLTAAILTASVTF